MGAWKKVVLEINELSGEAFKQSAKGTGETMEIECGILFRSIGYNGVPISGVPLLPHHFVRQVVHPLLPGNMHINTM